MNLKMLGGILLVVGTTIGGGMLALPIVLAQAGFWGGTALLFAAWALMTYTAFLLLDVNLWMPLNSNIILMAKKTLGKHAEIAAWITYLVLFYCLLAAYIAGGSDILTGLLNAIGVHPSAKLNATLFTLVLGGIVFHGIRSVDYANRILMLLKLGSFVLLASFLFPHVHSDRFIRSDLVYLVPAVTVVVTSFGFSNIVPSLRVYFHSDVQQLRRMMMIGSIIPLICYIIWVAVTIGAIPFDGEYGMLSVVTSDHSTLALTQALIHEINSSSITSLTRIFTSVCVLTSFLSVSLCVVDFLADGLRMEKEGFGKVFLNLITFIPPLLIAILYPTAFVVGLGYAGICITFLIVLLPVLMVWKGRYRLMIPSTYTVAGGKLPLILIMLISAYIMGEGIYKILLSFF